MAILKEKNMIKALPYLEDYVKRSTKVTQGRSYELSYVITWQANITKAIDGFKQLSGKEDSLSQHAMYLLGRCLSENRRKGKCKKCIFILRFQQQQ